MCLYGYRNRKRIISLVMSLLFCWLYGAHAQIGECSPRINIAVQAQTLCSANTPTIVATAIGGGSTPTYRWKKNGAVVGSNSATFSGALVVGDEIVCELTASGCANNATVVSNTFKLEALNLRDPEVTIVASATTICAGELVSFTATNRSGNTNPVYQWTINGNPAPASNNPVFVVANIPDGAAVQCIMTVPQCTTPLGGSTKDLSDVVTIKVGPALQPVVSIATPSRQVCKGAPVTFTATATNAGSNPQYLWKVNGTTVQTGGTSFSTTALSDGDQVQCQVEVAAGEGCGQPAPGLSNVLEMEVAVAETPTIAIAASQSDICFGTEVSFEATSTGAGSQPRYQWQVNGLETGSNLPHFTSTSLKDGDEVSCVLLAQTGCGNVNITSSPVKMKVRNPPLLTIPEDTITIWAGEQAQLKAAVSGEPHFYQWSPQGSLVFDQTLEPLTQPLESPVQFTVQATATNGCVAIGHIWVLVKRKLFVPNSFTPNGDGINDVFRIPPGIPIELKTFAVFDRWGNAVFTTKNPAEGWNGKNKSKPAPAGVYVYLIEGTYEGAAVILKGNLVLAK